VVLAPLVLLFGVPALSAVRTWPSPRPSAIGFGEVLKLVDRSASSMGTSRCRRSFWPFIGMSVSSLPLYVMIALAAAIGAVLGKGLGRQGARCLRFAICRSHHAVSVAWLHDSFDAGWPLVFFSCSSWFGATDIGAYIVGRSLADPNWRRGSARTKPGAGFFGGLGFAAAVAVCLIYWLPTHSKPWQVVEIAIGLLSLLGAGW